MATEKQNFLPLGKGVQYAIVDGAVILRVPVDKATVDGAALSASGKTRVVGTTQGFVTIPGTEGIKVGLNVTAPK